MERGKSCRHVQYRTRAAHITIAVVICLWIMRVSHIHMFWPTTTTTATASVPREGVGELECAPMRSGSPIVYSTPLPDVLSARAYSLVVS